MIEYNHPQGSPEWLASRAGVITASMFSTARDKTKKGEWSAAAKAYATRLALERIGGAPLDDGVETWAMKRGRELEPIARDLLSQRLGHPIDLAGFCKHEAFQMGASPDGFVGTAGVEIKCLVDPARIYRVVVDGDLSDFMDQIQGNLWITGRVSWYFALYLPQLATADRSLFYTTVYRNDAYIDDMKRDLLEFDHYVSKIEGTIREKFKKYTDAKEPF